MRRFKQWAWRVWTRHAFGKPVVNPRSDGFKWQARFELFVLATTPDDRAIHVIVDTRGGIGKSAWCKYMSLKHPSLFGMTSSHENMDIQLRRAHMILVFDAADSSPDDVNWEAILNAKIGMQVSFLRCML